MSVESCIHKSLNFALKVHQIDAFNFNLKKNIFCCNNNNIINSNIAEHVAQNCPTFGNADCLRQLGTKSTDVYHFFYEFNICIFSFEKLSPSLATHF